MTDESTEENRKSVPTVSAMLPTGELVELVYIPEERRTALAVGTTGNVSIEDAIDFGGTRLIPWNAENNLIKHEALLLPGPPEDFGTTGELIGEIESYLSRYVDLKEGLRKVVSAYVLLTWVYDAFNELPYLRFRGDLGS